MPQQNSKKDSTLLTSVRCQGQQGLRACSHSSTLVHADHFTACTWPCICHQNCQATCSVASGENKKRELRLLALKKEEPQDEVACGKTGYTKADEPHSLHVKPKPNTEGSKLATGFAAIKDMPASSRLILTCCKETLRANLQLLPCILCIGMYAWPANQQVGSESRQRPHTPYSNTLTTTCCLLLVDLSSNTAVHVCKTGAVHQQKLPFISKT